MLGLLGVFLLSISIPLLWGLFIFFFLYKMQAVEETLRVVVQKLGSTGTTIELPIGATIGDALEAAGLPRDVEARVGADLAKPNYKCENGDIIVVMTKAMTLG